MAHSNYAHNSPLFFSRFARTGIMSALPRNRGMKHSHQPHPVYHPLFLRQLAHAGSTPLTLFFSRLARTGIMRALPRKRGMKHSHQGMREGSLVGWNCKEGCKVHTLLYKCGIRFCTNVAQTIALPPRDGRGVTCRVELQIRRVHMRFEKKKLHSHQGM